jgi:hypothetical protein
MAINYASQFGNSKPEQFTPEQIHRLHGFDDGCMAVLKAFASSVQQKGYSESDCISRVNAMCIESLSPEHFANWESIKKQLKNKSSLTNKPTE